MYTVAYLNYPENTELVSMLWSIRLVCYVTPVACHLPSLKMVSKASAWGCGCLVPSGAFRAYTDVLVESIGQHDLGHAPPDLGLG